MALSRREFIWAAAWSSLALPAGVLAQRDRSEVFRHGVASGDPLADRVMLWTRITPSSDATTFDVRWTIAHDPQLDRVVSQGTVRTSADRDFTVKVDAGGLEPGRQYHYGFETGSERSPIGRTKTLPPDGVGRVRLAVVSCANYPGGYFNVYRCLANRPDLDAVLHLGDYIYEFPNGFFGDGTALGRLPAPPRETISLDDYRVRYATYRGDPDLQDAHRQHPFIAVWDDHELANDAWLGGAENHNLFEGDWPGRRTAAYRAYQEWMPVRETPGSGIELYRSFRFGSLADVIMLDTRALRDRQVAAFDVEGLSDPSRSILGATQEAWLFDQLRQSQRAGTPWRLLGQQVMFSQMSMPGRPTPLPDAWDGYQASRARVLDFLAAEKLGGVAILSGDFHSSWAFDVPADPWRGYAPRSGAGSATVELMAPAVSSEALFTSPIVRQNGLELARSLPHLKYVEGDSQGYLLVDVSRERLLAEWHYVPGVLARSARESMAYALVCERGSSRLAPA